MDGMNEGGGGGGDDREMERGKRGEQREGEIRESWRLRVDWLAARKNWPG